MSVEYIPDSDLDFLQNIHEKKLKDLMTVILYDRKNEKRTAASSNSFEKLGAVEDSEKWKIYAAELQNFAGNTIVNTLRGGKGIKYSDAIECIAERLELEEKIKEFGDVASKENYIIGLLTNHVNKLLEQDDKIESKIGLAAVLRERYDDASDMERFLCDTASGRKNFFQKIGNVLWTRTPLNGLGENYAVLVQAMVRLSILRESSSGVSLAMVGSAGTGKTTFKNLLQNGKFVGIDKGTSGIVPYKTFFSPLIGQRFGSGIDSSGHIHYVKEQIDATYDADVVFVFFNPFEIINDSNKRSDFAGRTGTLWNIKDKVRFIATRRDEYIESFTEDGVTVIEKVFQLMSNPEIGCASQIFKRENCFFMELSKVDETAKTVREILETVNVER